jgi:hypothetical protein
MTARLEKFVSFSAKLTAFTAFELYGTGQAQPYLSTIDDVVGAELVDDLLDLYTYMRDDAQQPAVFENSLRADILSDERLGPVARNVIKLWYVGIWYELPRAWTQSYGARELNTSFTVSAAAYTEGLLWPAIGASPPGAKAPGYGSWADPPRIPHHNGTAP